MPENEEMFMFHGYSGPCPKPPLPRVDHKKRLADLLEVARIKSTRRWQGEDYPEQYGEVRLGIEATEHLREILRLVEEAQACWENLLREKSHE
jgi:hypothetical protein